MEQRNGGKSLKERIRSGQIRVEDMPTCATPVYRWALCTGKGSDEIWGE